MRRVVASLLGVVALVASPAVVAAAMPCTDGMSCCAQPDDEVLKAPTIAGRCCCELQQPASDATASVAPGVVSSSFHIAPAALPAVELGAPPALASRAVSPPARARAPPGNTLFRQRVSFLC